MNIEQHIVHVVPVLLPFFFSLLLALLVHAELKAYQRFHVPPASPSRCVDVNVYLVVNMG
jgi:hypothetical protein